MKLGSLYQYQFEARVRPFYLTRAILHVRAPMGPSRYGECLASHNMGDLQLFPRQEGRKSRISLLTADGYGGKAACSGSPLLGVEEVWHVQLYRRWLQR